MRTKNKLAQFLSFLAILSIALAACGSPAPTATSGPSGPEITVESDSVTETFTPTNTAVPSLQCGPVVYQNNGTCVSDIATFNFNNMVVHANLAINPAGNTLHIDVEKIQSGNNLEEQVSCYVNGHFTDTPSDIKIDKHATTLHWDLSCSVDQNYISGEITIPTQAPLGLTLTASAPSPTNTVAAAWTVKSENFKLDGVSCTGPNNQSGRLDMPDSKNSNFTSVAIYDYTAKIWYIGSTSAQRVSFFSGNSGQTQPMVGQYIAAFENCVIKTKLLSGIPLSPAFWYAMPKGMSFSAPSLNKDNATLFEASKLGNGATTYSPHISSMWTLTPTRTPTAANTPVPTNTQTATATATATATPTP
jgi:hypothetical protein